MSKRAQIWVIDDDRSIRWVLEKALKQADMEVRAFEAADTALKELSRGEPDALITDIRMPGMNGLELLNAITTDHRDLPVIIMTAHSDLDSAVSAYQGGAFEYLPKPFDVDEAVELARRAVAHRRDQASAAASPVAGKAPEIIGEAPSMQEVFRAIGRLARSNITVLINGESGTGKELVASALHRHSPRADKPFIALNTAAIPRDLLESELFGHERGAFTGAQAMRQGRFEQANGGTLFLDEIGDISPAFQAKLLRVLQEREFERVGGHQPIKADARVIAATHQNLEERVRQGLFREDLYHRLNVIRLRLPPLRERREDIPLLARHFLAKSARELGVEPKRLSEEALKHIQQLPFPGNVRQLENLCHWLTVLAPAQVVKLDDLPVELRTQAASTAAAPLQPAQQLDVAASAQAPVASAPARDWRALLVDEVERRLAEGQTDVMTALARDFEGALIRTALRHTRGRRIEAALKLGVGRNTITRKIQELGLED